jgi:hypothetical protein
MKKLLSVIITVMLIMIMGIGVAQAEYRFPGDGFNDGLMGTESKPWRQVWGNTVCFEGATANAFETYLSAVEPTGVNIIQLPDESGTIVTTGSSDALTNDNIARGADGTILISNNVGTGEVIWAAHTLTGDVTGTMLNSGATATTITPGSDGQVLISNNSGGGEVIWVTTSGDVTITNAGVTTIGSNKVGTAESNINSVSLTIQAGTAWNGVTVESGSTLMGWYITNEGAITAGSVYMNTVEWDGTTFKATLNTSGAGATEVTGTFLRP